MPEEYLPPFISPLTHDQHARLGRIAVLWGQIDMILDQLLDKTIGITSKQRMTLIGDKQFGSKLDMLSRHIADIQDGDTRENIKEFWELSNQTKTLRNRAFHGIWGFRCVRTDKVIPAATHWRAAGDPVKLTQLPALEKKLCKTARVGFNAMVKLHQFNESPTAVRLFHGAAEDAPAWLPEWSAQHPLDDDALDRRWKLGQLPYLTNPL